jgi:hypothetical protein
MSLAKFGARRKAGAEPWLLAGVLEARSSGIDAGGSYGHHPAVNPHPTALPRPRVLRDDPAAAHPRLASRQMAGYCARPAQRSATTVRPARRSGSDGTAQLILDVDLDDLVERTLGGETEARRPGEFHGRGPGPDDGHDRLVRLTADQLDRLLPGHPA